MFLKYIEQKSARISAFNGPTGVISCHNFLTVNQSSHRKVSEVNHEKLDRVGPIDNKPSTDYLHHIVQFFKDFLNIYFV